MKSEFSTYVDEKSAKLTILIELDTKRRLNRADIRATCTKADDMRLTESTLKIANELDRNQVAKIEISWELDTHSIYNDLVDSMKIECAPNALREVYLFSELLTAYVSNPYDVYRVLLQYSREVNENHESITAEHYIALDNDDHEITCLRVQASDDKSAIAKVAKLIRKRKDNRELLENWAVSVKHVQASGKPFDVKLADNNLLNTSIYAKPVATTMRIMTKTDYTCKRTPSIRK